jgi:hypothetical protein
MKLGMLLLTIFASFTAHATSLTEEDSAQIFRVFERYIVTSQSAPLTSETDFYVREIKQSRDGKRLVYVSGVTCSNRAALGSRSGYVACSAEIKEFVPGRWVIDGYTGCSSLSPFEYEIQGSDFYRAFHQIQCPGS